MPPPRPLYLTNTMGHSVQEFQPLDRPRVKLYGCGPTVYSYVHIGNLRAFLLADVLRRVLEYNGYDVTHVRNITDVGHLTNDTLSTGADKIEEMAKKQNVTPWDIAMFYTEAFLREAKLINLLEPHFQPRATEYVDRMIELTQRLMDLGKAYQADGNVYFDVSTFPSYGALSGNTVDDLIAGARVEVGGDKRSGADFALWRAAGPDKIMRWQSPWGEGVPGWHIECSAMSMALLGEQLDIHTGAVDNIFSHHEDERAQSEAATGKQFVRYWLHNAWLLFGDEKMSKSLGNLYTITDLQAQGFHPLSYRYFTFQAHYRTPLTFRWSALEGAQIALYRLWEAVAELVQDGDVAELCGEAAGYKDRFHASINRDLDMPGAVAVVHEALGAKKLPAAEKLALATDFDRVLGLDLVKMGKALSQTTTEQRRILEERAEARSNKAWSRSDELRDQARAAGLEIKDTPRGQRWVRRDLLPVGAGEPESASEDEAEKQPGQGSEAETQRPEDGVRQ